jgi:hypothetical protein
MAIRRPVIIKVSGDAGQRGPRGFPLRLKGTKEFPAELSGQYKVGEDVLEGLQPGDSGYETPVIGFAYIIGKDVWVYDDIEVWINAGAIRSGVSIAGVNATDPDVPPSVVDVGDEFDAVLLFDLPRAPITTIGTIETVNPDQLPDVSATLPGGDVELDFSLPRAPQFTVGSVEDSEPGGNPVVTDSGVDGDINLNFVIPRGATGPSDTRVDNVLFVASDGDDVNNSGESIADPYLTIEKALTEATAGTTVFVKSGDYTENNPLTIPAGVSIVGDSLRTVTVRPANSTSDIFYVNNGCYITGITFRDHLDPAAAFAFDPNGGAGNIFTSPYIQNCSSITTTGKGAFINGGVVGGVRSMVMDSFTQFNQGGIGVHLTEGAYAQIVSVFTICCDIGFLAESGATASISNSNCAFGNIGVKADGRSNILYQGVTLGTTAFGTTIDISIEQDPVIGDGVTFDSGQTFYVVDSFEAIEDGETLFYRVTLTTGLEDEVLDDSVATFHALSTFSVSAHTFEFVGTGTDLATATPRLGGVPIQENEIVEAGEGKVYFTSTDQKGDFRIGQELIINNQSGIITGTTFERSLFAVMTPYILAIEG